MSFGDLLARFWSEHSQRERMVLVAGAGVALLIALYMLLWEPGLAVSSKLSATLPRLRAQVEDMRRQQSEITALRKKLGTAPQSRDLKSLLQASVARSSFLKSVQRMDALASDRVFVVMAAANFDDWLGWIGNLQREFGVRLDACKITALEQPGLVRVEATFVLAGASRKTP
jgi:general secretion pathway protein M